MIQDGLAAKAAGQDEVATAKLGRAVQLADQTGNDEMTTRLKKVVEIDDADTGTVRLKKSASEDRRDVPRHGLDEDEPGAPMSASAPTATVPGRRLLRHVRVADRGVS